MASITLAAALAATPRPAAHGDARALAPVPRISRDTPRRLIVLCRGRGGSTVLSKTLAVFAHSDPHFLHRELFGGNETAMESVDHPAEVMATWFDQMEQTQPEADLVGFKWKPDVFSDAYDEAWEWVVQHNVSVVWMTRNLLDVRISRGKRNGKPKGELSAHCRAGDAACVEEHRSIKVHLNASTLVETLTHDREKYEERLQKLLDQKGVRYLRVAFDELFVGEDEGGVGRMRLMLRPHSDFALGSWNRIFSFVGLPPVDDYAAIQNVISSESASTHPATNCASVENLQEVQAALRGTRFEHLLGCLDWRPADRPRKSCPPSEQNAKEAECAAAVMQVASGDVVGEKIVELGPDSWVPAGCSYNTQVKTAVFNTHEEGGSRDNVHHDGNPYRLICRSRTRVASSGAP